MKKKVMFLLYTMNVGGTERALLNMLDIMNPDLFDVDVYLLKECGGLLYEFPDWVNVKILPGYDKINDIVMKSPIQVIKNFFKKGKWFFSVKLLFWYVVSKLIKDNTGYLNVAVNSLDNIKQEYDCAIAYAGPFDFISLYILNKVKAKEKIQWIHFDVSKIGFNSYFAQKNYIRFDKIVVVSSYAADVLINKVVNIDDKIKVIPNFLSKKICVEKSMEYIPYTKEELDNKYIILTVGRLSKEKGQDMIPDIVRGLRDKGIDNFVWYVIGEGNLSQDIKNKIQEYSLKECLKLEGLKKNPYPYYKYCDLYVQTSLHEGYCITIAEALLFDKYVISTDVAGAYDQIKTNKQGKIVNVDVTSIINEIYKKIIQIEGGGKGCVLKNH